MNDKIKDIKNELREGHSSSLHRRRKLGLLSAIGMIDFGIISLYQMGVIKSLPDIPGEIFDSNKVNAAEKAYAMHLPDGTTGAGMYSFIMMLASINGSKRSGRSPWWSAALGVVVAGGALGAADYLRDMIFKQKKACVYCLTGAAINFAMVPLVWKEIKEELLPVLAEGNYRPVDVGGNSSLRSL